MVMLTLYFRLKKPSNIWQSLNLRLQMQKPQGKNISGTFLFMRVMA